tara:strand:- start:430 stop:750 length:321 start_codon:yes stop_codon:yes gene_type:complete
MKVGISLKIDVTKIDKTRLYAGQKGTYLDLTTFIDTDVADKYENHGFISQSTTKEEREAKYQTPILGNVKVFYTDGAAPAAHQGQAPALPTANPMDMSDFDNDIPF